MPKFEIYNQMITSVSRKYLYILAVCTIFIAIQPTWASPLLPEPIIVNQLSQPALEYWAPSYVPNSELPLMNDVQRIDKNISFAANSAPTTDPWLGQDKVLHVGLSTSIAGGTTLASQNGWLGFGVCMGIGLFKELIYDQIVPNHTPSYKDMVANTLGCSAGALVGRWVSD